MIDAPVRDILPKGPTLPAASRSPATARAAVPDTAALSVSACLAVFGSLVAVVIGAIALAARAGLPDSGARVILTAVGTVWFVINWPLVVRPLACRTGSVILSHLAFLTTTTLLGVLAFGWLAGSALGLPVAVVGVVALLWNARYVLTAGNRRAAVLLLFAAALTGMALAGTIWGNGYLSPCFLEGLPYGRGQVDEVHHIDVCNMIRTYGTPSIGLDGVPYLPYHTGSHFALARIAGLLGATTTEAYALAFPIIFLPLFAYTLLLSGAAVSGAGNVRSARMWCVVWLVLMLAVAGFVPQSVGNAMGLWGEMVFISESMCVGLVLLFLGMAVILPEVNAAPDQAPPSRADRLLAGLLFPAYVLVLGMVKISVAALLVAAVCYLFIRRRGLRTNLRAWSSLGLALLAAGLAAKLTFYPAYGRQLIYPLHFLRSYLSSKDSWAYFFLLKYAWLLLAAWLRLRQEDVADAAGLVRSLRAGALIDVELLVLIAVVGLLPGLTLRIAGGGAMHFHNVQQWASLVVILGVVFSVRRPQRSAASAAVPATSGGRLTALQVGGAALLFPVFLTMLLNVASMLTRAIHENLACRGVKGVSVGRAVGQLLRTGRLETSPPDAARAALLATLRRIGQLPLAQKRVSVLYVPKTNRTYWEFFPPSLSDGKDLASLRKANPQLGPALCGVALIDGLPDPEEGVQWEYYGYDLYPIPTGPQKRSPPPERQAEVCRKAAALGFSRVIVLDGDTQGVRLLEWCLPGSQPVLTQPGKAAAQHAALDRRLGGASRPVASRPPLPFSEIENS